MSPQIKKKQVRSNPGKNQFGVRITVEFVGHLDKKKAVQFTESLGSVLANHMENGGGGN